MRPNWSIATTRSASEPTNTWPGGEYPPGSCVGPRHVAFRVRPEGSFRPRDVRHLQLHSRLQRLGPELEMNRDSRGLDLKRVDRAMVTQRYNFGKPASFLATRHFLPV